MKGKGNGFGTLFRKLFFMLIPTSGGRTKYINKHKHMFRHVGEKLFFQPREFPSEPERIYFGDNVKISTGVFFINHDITNHMLSVCSDIEVKGWGGAIKIGNNVMIGAKCIIMPDVMIGNNVVIAAGSIVAKDIPDNTVAAGIPAKPIGTFENLVTKRKNSKFNGDNLEQIWEDFYNKRNLPIE